MARITCPHCGGPIDVTRKAKPAKHGGTVNPYGHPFPHAKLYNTVLTPRLIGATGNHCGHMIENNDPRNYSISGNVPGSEAASC
jgi:rRNA maturation protein Nop10